MNQSPPALSARADESIVRQQSPISPAAPRSLYSRQALALITLFVLTGLLFVFLGWLLARRHLDVASQQLNRSLAARIVADSALVSATTGDIDTAAVKRTFEHYMHANPAIELYLLDTTGEIKAFSADPGKVKRDRVDLGPVMDFLSGEKSLPIVGDDPRGLDRRKVFSASRLSELRPELGYLYVVLQGEAFDMVRNSFSDSYLLRALAVALAVSLGTGLAVSLVVFRLLGRRLASLSSRIASFGVATGDQPSGFSSHHGHDELTLLETSFDQMSDRIRQQMDALSETDRKRREFIAHVSHDLRTPLTLVNAHLESLAVRFDRIDESTRHEHIAAARAEGERLAHLVNDLFQLARLDNAAVDIARDPLNLEDLIQDVAHKHNIAASNQGVTITATVNDRLPLIEGDVGLLERLFDNLLSNALTHTPDGGRINIAATAGDNTVTIRVQDNGNGIDPALAERIFEPGFQLNATENNQAGLGLAIARRISSWHGGTLTLEAKPGHGAEFVIVLPVTADADGTFPGESAHHG